MSDPSDGPEPGDVVLPFPGIDLLRSDNHAIHTHGGPAARLGALHLRFEVHDQRAHTIEARRVELLQRHCREDAWGDRKALAITKHRARPQDAATEIASGAASVVIPVGGPRTYRVTIEVEPFEVYQACDHFGFAVDLVVDRVRQPVVIPLHVTREEPAL